ncbi:MAG TPA: hypothetical protein VF370_05995 [Candidatus Cryosericum sp.]
MVKQPENAHKKWTAAEKIELKKLAQGNTPTRVIGMKLKRTPGAVQAEASRIDVSLDPPNQSPYNRRKK